MPQTPPTNTLPRCRKPALSEVEWGQSEAAGATKIAFVRNRHQTRIGTTAAAVEFSRLLHTPAFDAFRLTFAGRFLLGRFFSLKNIAAYWLVIALTASLDRRFHPGRE